MWMAWRLAAKKKPVCATLAKVFNVTSHEAASICKFNIDAPFKSLPVLLGWKQVYGLHTVAHDVEGIYICGGKSFVRNFHASHESLDAYRDKDGRRLSRLQKPRKNNGKFRKKQKVNEAPVETPYVPPRLKRADKSSPDKTIEIFEGMTILELSNRCGQSLSTVQRILVTAGEKIDSEFDHLSIDIAELVAMEVGVNVRRLHSNVGKELLPRPPVVTVMGHVDHGKTSLLDALRQTAVAASEAGGITQHLGAFVVGMKSGAAITFLDTPGHAAFSAMRARGAAVTDIVVLVVAADDGVMPQTLEAISHAKAAGVSIVVAINKCDKPGANPERVKTQLVTEGLPLEEIGGDIQVVEVSAINKTGLDKLEEALLLEAEMMELKARIDGPAQAYVVEARIDKGRGPVATVIVKAGTLLSGQHVVVGAEWGRIRAIRDMVKILTNRATPAMPVEIEGLKGLPMAGDDIVVVESEERARMLSEGRKKKLEKDRLMQMDEERRKVLEERRQEEEEEEEADEQAELEALGSETTILRKKEKKRMWIELPIVVKADVQGTIQAVIDALKTLTSPQVFVKIVHSGLGPISASDVDMASACGACIVGFNVPKPPISITQAATQDGIKLILHRVIYHLLEDIGNLIVEKAPGTFETQVAGEAEVLGIFEILGKRNRAPVKIAGCRVIDGRVMRDSKVKVLRSGEVIFEGECESLKKETRDAEIVEKGSECGLILHKFNLFQVGDVIQCLEQVNRKPKFISESGTVRIEC